jgi:hypothetical protein
LGRRFSTSLLPLAKGRSAIAANGSAFAEAFDKGFEHTDERRVIPSAGEVHHSLEVAGQFRIAKGVEDSRDADDDLSSRLNILTKGLGCLVFPTLSCLHHGFNGLGNRFLCELGVEIDCLLGLVLGEAKIFEQRASLGGGSVFDLEALGDFERFVLLRNDRFVTGLRRFGWLRRLSWLCRYRRIEQARLGTRRIRRWRCRVRWGRRRNGRLRRGFG